MLLQREKACLLIVDVQEKLTPHVRQAELLVRGPVSLADLDHVVVHSSAAARSISALDQKRVVQIAGVFDW